MAFHRGNAFLSNVTADDLRTEWKAWQIELDDQYATLVPDVMMYSKYFNTRNLIVLSFFQKVTFNSSTPFPYQRIAFTLPDEIKVKRTTYTKSNAIIERFTGTQERKFSNGAILVDGETKGGVDNVSFLHLDKVFVENYGLFIAGQTYIINGQITFEPE